VRLWWPSWAAGGDVSPTCACRSVDPLPKRLGDVLSLAQRHKEVRVPGSGPLVARGLMYGGRCRR
jgi:hypothetical protein